MGKVVKNKRLGTELLFNVHFTSVNQLYNMHYYAKPNPVSLMLLILMDFRNMLIKKYGIVYCAF